ncbi:hypothetical protein ACIP98_15495 [Streptomyces sp. NPDC088354]|uniref:hypothetical protein n=1 Tax=unclassified Streptomyces TaxID=2593676 RepID=UPI0029AF2D18|nr:hypothetical protein [Streptomyces sp. MI02-7b]MDX3074516.1 hypothetical protein [Streptomyces sp. MI02-7b]
MDLWALLGLERGRLVHFLLAGALCVLSLLLTAATWLPGPRLVPHAVAMAVLLLVFPVCGAAFVRALTSGGAAQILGRGNGVRLFWFVWDLPARLKWFYGAVFALCLLGLAGGGGEDVRTDAHGVHYVTRKDAADPRGERVALTNAQYDSASRAESRTITTGAAIFFALSGIVVLVEASSWRPLPSPQTDPERPR